MRSAGKAGVAAAVALSAGAFALGSTTSSDLPAAVCLYREAGALPDPLCTPGVRNPMVTQRTIGRTICVSGWTKTVRPRSLEREKVLSMRQYGVADQPKGAFEYDHHISLQLGGHPSDPRNLWPEPYDVPDDNDEWDARDKDIVESFLKRAVCAGRITLRKAQRMIASDWREAIRG